MEFLAHSVLQGLNLTVERLDLPPGLIGLLLGLPQRIIIALCRLSQVSKLRGQRRQREVMFLILFFSKCVDVWLC